MSFEFPTILWALPAASIPVLIHLINRLRHRRVRWAAMELLLESHRKYRRSILLRQWLLLAARVVLIALIVLLLAGPRLTGNWSNWVGAERIHHVVLVDDTYSMSDRWAGSSAIDQAKTFLAELGPQLTEAAGLHRMTIQTYSRAAGSEKPPPPMVEQPVDADFESRLARVIDELDATDASIATDDAIDAVVEMLPSPRPDRVHVYILSDFRARDWGATDPLRNALEELRDDRTRVTLVGCVDRARPNLAIAGLHLPGNLRTVDVPMPLAITVVNFGQNGVRDQVVHLDLDGEPLTSFVIPLVPARQSIEHLAHLTLHEPGIHRLTARLPTDAIDTDNTRDLLIRSTPSATVLIVDGTAEHRDGHYLATALAPGGPARTGFFPEVVASEALGSLDLDPYACVYLLDVAILPKQATAAIERYVAQGGGLGVFLGANTDPDVVNTAWYREGAGFFPAPLLDARRLAPTLLRTRADVEAVTHPALSFLEEDARPLLDRIRIDQYFAIAPPNPSKDGPPPDSVADQGESPHVAVGLTLRDGQPLLIEKSHGDGRVVTVLTTLGPRWNNWARGNPSFVVAALELTSYLMGRPADDEGTIAGRPLVVPIDAAAIDPRVEIQPPDSEGAPTVATLTSRAEGERAAVWHDTLARGLYEVHQRARNLPESTTRRLVNVDPEEGDTEIIARGDLQRDFGQPGLAYASTADWQYRQGEASSADLHLLLILLVAGLLVGEQYLAYLNSYHERPSTGASSRRGAGVRARRAPSIPGGPS